MIEGNGGVMVKLHEMELKMLIKGGETNTVELKLAAPRAVDLAERFCGTAIGRYSPEKGSRSTNERGREAKTERRQKPTSR
jgi:hypothetical protein